MVEEMLLWVFWSFNMGLPFGWILFAFSGVTRRYVFGFLKTFVERGGIVYILRNPMSGTEKLPEVL